MDQSPVGITIYSLNEESQREKKTQLKYGIESNSDIIFQ